MKRQQWMVGRKPVGHPTAQRRWDRAYQLLLQAAVAPASLSALPATPQVAAEESRHAGSRLRPGCLIAPPRSMPLRFSSTRGPGSDLTDTVGLGASTAGGEGQDAASTAPMPTSRPRAAVRPRSRATRGAPQAPGLTAVRPAEADWRGPSRALRSDADRAIEDRVFPAPFAPAPTSRRFGVVFAVEVHALAARWCPGGGGSHDVSERGPSAAAGIAW